MTERLTIVVPVFNERAVLPAFHERLGRVLAEAELDAEILYIDDGSTDGSGVWLDREAASTDQVSILSLSRNFGKEIAMTAGLDHADADAVVIIDADLQDPPELIPELILELIPELQPELTFNLGCGARYDFLLEFGFIMLISLKIISDHKYTGPKTIKIEKK